jgi:hypothetical protein
VLALDEEVLADSCPSHELVVHAATDLSGFGFDDDVLQPATFEHALVRLVHHAVGLAHAVLVPIDRVGILHEELATTQEPVPWAELVAVLPFHLIHALGKVPIRGQIRSRQLGHHLLLGRPEQHLAPVPIREPEHLVPVQVPPARGLPRFRRQRDRHPELLRPRLVHLLADDPLDLAHHAEAERQGGVHAGGDLPDEAASQQQAMTGDLGFGRILAKCRNERSGQTHERTG